MSGLEVDNRIEIDGSINFRDLGGYQTESGHQVTYGKIYRSGDLSKLTAKGVKQLQQLNIKQICDFRSENERIEYPDPIIPSVRNVHMPVMPEQEVLLDPRKSMDYFVEQLEEGNPENILITMNRRMVEQTDVWKNLLQALLDDSTVPLVFHCAAGKDRTGVGSAVILRTLGVSEELVLEDYMKTNQAINQLLQMNNTNFPTEWIEKYKDVAQVMMEARSAYLQAFFDEINQQYGSFDNYLHKGLSISSYQQEKIWSNYLN
ncbi:tyrosine-protein phosphatase [Gracilibacillus suaedae]|uniref:tyrosine-protein phosphatase n=1 Tax=Gracilibacillus suaedae TaxID=2820273 RepID=UPI001ABEC7B8|nr:tyrosine-protein phosphatase [Gracilibacillus suaedae]